MNEKFKLEHALFVMHRILKENFEKKGGIDYFISYLEKRNVNCTLILSPLYQGSHVVVKEKTTTKKYFIGNIFPFKHVLEVIINIFLVFKQRKKSDIIFAVDPLSFFSVRIATLFLNKKIVFHIPDYSEKRFNSIILNRVYHILFKIALISADEITIPSRSVYKVARKFVKVKSKIHHIPNSPNFSEVPKSTKASKSTFYVINSKTFLTRDECNLILEILDDKAIKNLKIKFIISGDAKNYLEKENKNIINLGLVNYEANMQWISRSSVGFAYYDGFAGFEKYADSLKIREYAAAGLPILSNDYVETANEGSSQGAVLICNTKKDYIMQLEALYRDDKFYEEISRNAIRWAMQTDKNKLLENFFTSILVQ